MCTDFGGSGEEVEVVEVQEYVGDPAYGTATTQLHKVDIYTNTSTVCGFVAILVAWLTSETVLLNLIPSLSLLPLIILCVIYV